MPANCSGTLLSVADEAGSMNKEGELDRVNHRSTTLPIAPMDTQQPRRRVPKIQFRVLIIGRANAGKTTILQRVCDTTESPIVYRRDGRTNTKVRGPTFFSASLIPLPTSLNLTHPWKLVTIVLLVG
jgi:hypothetical protein